jgi:hypothetical protein
VGAIASATTASRPAGRRDRQQHRAGHVEIYEPGRGWRWRSPQPGAPAMVEAGGYELYVARGQREPRVRICRHGGRTPSTREPAQGTRRARGLRARRRLHAACGRARSRCPCSGATGPAGSCWTTTRDVARRAGITRRRRMRRYGVVAIAASATTNSAAMIMTITAANSRRAGPATRSAKSSQGAARSTTVGPPPRRSRSVAGSRRASLQRLDARVRAGDRCAPSAEFPGSEAAR